jgi:transcriptional regulator with XRE-family HTH domain
LIVGGVGGSRFSRQFGERVRELREARQKSQEQLADDAGLHRTHISLIERGRRSVRLETIERLAVALRVQPAEMMPPIRFAK